MICVAAPPQKLFLVHDYTIKHCTSNICWLQCDSMCGTGDLRLCVRCFVGFVFVLAISCDLSIAISAGPVIPFFVVGSERHSVYEKGVLDSILHCK